MCHSYLIAEIQKTVLNIWLIDFSHKKTEKQRRDLLNDISYHMETWEGLRGRKLATLNRNSEVSLQENTITLATAMALDILYQGFCNLHP